MQAAPRLDIARAPLPIHPAGAPVRTKSVVLQVAITASPLVGEPIQGAFADSQ